MKIIFFILFALSSQVWAQGFLPHDISILFPPPSSLPDPDAIKVDSFLTKAAVRILPQLEPTLSTATQGERFQVVSIRIDPPELRLVWQAWRKTAKGVEALDAAIHSFYKIENEKQFLIELKEISKHTRGEVSLLTPISIHPTLYREGLRGQYGQELKRFISKHAHHKNLFKMTFMSMKVAGTVWDFSGLHIQNDKFTSLSIPRTANASSQMFINNSFHEFSGGFWPAPKIQDEFNRLVADSYKAQAKEQEKLKKVHETSRRIENPRLETTDSVDCVSCHLAQTTRVWTENVDASLKNEIKDKFVSKKYLLANKTDDPTRTDNVHMFGYFFEMATITQRVINDTAFTLERLNK